MEFTSYMGYCLSGWINTDPLRHSRFLSLKYPVDKPDDEEKEILKEHQKCPKCGEGVIVISNIKAPLSIRKKYGDYWILCYNPDDLDRCN